MPLTCRRGTEKPFHCHWNTDPAADADLYHRGGVSTVYVVLGSSPRPGTLSTLYERGKLVGEISRASSKLLHGGLRYLEQGQFRLVREALRERDGWLRRVPSLARPFRLVLPVYKHSRRQRWTLGVGLFLYEHLAGCSSLPASTWLTAETLLRRDPKLRTAGLKGGFEFSDGQMDDHKLGLWVAEQARRVGSCLHEDTSVNAVDPDGRVHFHSGSARYDWVVNVCGPWAAQLLEKSAIPSPYRLDTVRGSHLVLNPPCAQAYLLEVPGEKRIFFALPWQGKTLLGTTEIRQTLNDPITCSPTERDYLLAAYNHYRTDAIGVESMLESFAGIRPLLYSANDPGHATREYAIHRTGKVINVFGGKWTTALALANKLSRHIH